MNRKLLPAAALALLLTGCHHDPPQVQTVTPAPPVAVPGPQNAVPTPPRHLVVYVPGPGGDGDSLVARPVALTHSQNPARAALEALTNAPHGPLPEGTRLRGVKVEAGLATVDFSRELVSHFHGSEQEEAQTVNSVLRTLGQFDTIDRVQFLVDGKPVDALSQLPLNAPLDVIRPDATPPPVVASAAGHGQ